MNTDDYKYILTIAEEKSITRAAEKLYISQPALSQRIKHVRKELGIELFITDKNGIYLTNDGRCFARYARKILQEEENMKQELQEMHNTDCGSLTIGVPQMSNSRYFKRLITAFHDKYPQVKLNIMEFPSVELKKFILNGRIDLGIFHISSQKHLGPDYQYEAIFQDRLVFMLGSKSSLKQHFFYKPSCQIPYISPEILVQEPLALPESTTESYALFYNILHKVHAEATVNHWSRSYSALATLAEIGLSNAIFLQSFLDDNMAPGDYSFIDTGENDSIQTVVAYAANRYVPKIMNHFIELSKEIWDSTYPNPF